MFHVKQYISQQKYPKNENTQTPRQVKIDVSRETYWMLGGEFGLEAYFNRRTEQ